MKDIPINTIKHLKYPKPDPEQVRDLLNEHEALTVECPTCEGDGVVYDPNDWTVEKECPTCRRAGRIPKGRSVAWSKRLVQVEDAIRRVNKFEP